MLGSMIMCTRWTTELYLSELKQGYMIHDNSAGLASLPKFTVSGKGVHLQ